MHLSITATQMAWKSSRFHDFFQSSKRYFLVPRLYSWNILRYFFLKASIAETYPSHESSGKTSTNTPVSTLYFHISCREVLRSTYLMYENGTS